MQTSSPLLHCLPARWAGLKSHPDQEFECSELDGIKHGFRVGFDHASPLRPVRQNMPSADAHLQVIDHYIGKEVAGGCIMGPFPHGYIPALHINWMGVVPKGHTLRRWHLITDLSFSECGSVNGGIAAQLCLRRYMSVDTVAAAACGLGPGTLLAKMDVSSAYRLVPVHSDDQLLLGLTWQNADYVDGMLLFGLRLAPKIFTTITDALEWLLWQHGIHKIDYYLEDFVTMGAPGSTACARSLDLILQTCVELGVPLAMHKLDSPTTRMVFLGIEINM